MPSTYTLNNGIELIATGEQSGTWGDTTNTNLELLDTALDGQVTVTLASAGSSGSPNTLPISDGAASNGRNRMVIFDDSSDLGATAYVQLTPNDAEKIIYVRNSLSGSRSILLFQGTYNASNDYELKAGTTAVIFFDGAGSGAVAANVLSDLQVENLSVFGTAPTITLTDTDTGVDTELNAASSVGQFTLNIDKNNEGSSPRLVTQISGTEFFRINESGAVFNESSEDQDFRVESNDKTHMLFVDAGNNHVNIGGTGTDHGGLLNMDAPDGSFIVMNGTSNNKGFINWESNGFTFYTNGPVEGLRIGSSETVVNEDGRDYDFRVESDNNASALFVDAGNDRIGLFNGSPSAPLHLIAGTSGGSLSDAFQISDSGYVNIAMYSGGADGEIRVGTSGILRGVYKAQYAGTRSANDFSIGANLINAITFDSGGPIKVNDGGLSTVDFRVESDSDTHMFFVDAGNNRVSVNSSGLGSGDFNVSGNTLLEHSGIVSSQSNTALTIRDADSTAMRANFIVEDNINSSRGGLMIQATESGVTNDRDIYLQPHGGRVGILTSTPASGFDCRTAAVFNEAGADNDFRVESDNNANMLFVNAGDDKIGLGTGSTSGGVVTIEHALDNSSDWWTNAKNALFLGNTNASGQTVIKLNNQTNTRASLVFNTSGTGRFQLFDRTSAQERLGSSTSETVMNEDSADIDFRVESNAYANMFLVDAGANQVRLGTSAGSQVFATTSPQLEVTTGGSGGGGVGIKSDSSTSSTKSALSVWTRANGSGSTAYAISFYDGPSGTAEGSITVTNSGTTYNTTSDRRLKTDIQPIANGTEKLMAMNPVSHKWIADPEADAVHGFIAQEMQEIVPEAVSGDPDGEEMMSMDYGRITPVLVAALQDAHNKIAALEERLVKLEAK